MLGNFCTMSPFICSLKVIPDRCLVEYFPASSWVMVAQASLRNILFKKLCESETKPKIWIYFLNESGAGFSSLRHQFLESYPSWSFIHIFTIGVAVFLKQEVFFRR